MLTRRLFLGSSAAGAALLAAPALAQARPRVVVVGGGPGGATAARHLALAHAGRLDVTLVEPQPVYQTCLLSNHFLGGLRDFDKLSVGYEGVTAAGVTLLTDRAAGIDRSARRVTTEGGAQLDYDHLVLSPGIAFVPGSVPGWDEAAHAEIMPHAYRGGPQVQLLRRQIEAMPVGGVFCLIAPPDPYRCPPAPYERVSMVAHLLGQINPTASILLVDPKEKYSKQGLFEEGWQNHYPGVVTRLGPDMGGDLIEVRPEAMEVVVDGEVNAVAACNVIPAQRAGVIADAAGLTGPNGWVPVRAQDMRATADAAVTVLGDAADQGAMPKGAYAANSQARVAAAAIAAELLGTPPAAPDYANACWSMIAPEDGVKLAGTYAPGPDGRMVETSRHISDYAEPAELRARTAREKAAWYAEFIKDAWGATS